MHCIFMIFTEHLYGMHGYIVLKFHLICMRFDEVTGAGTYKYAKIVSNMNTGYMYVKNSAFLYFLGLI